MVRGVMLAGVTGAGKSTILATLARRLSADPDLSFAVFRNDLVQTQIYARYRATNSIADLARFLADPLDVAERLAAWSSGGGPMSRSPPQVLLLFESWLLNLCAELGLEDFEAFEALDRRRAAAGLMLVHLQIPRELVLERSVLSTSRFRGEGWRAYLLSLGEDAGMQAREFERRRLVIERLFSRCAPPKLGIDTTEMRWDRYASEIEAASLPGARVA